MSEEPKKKRGRPAYEPSEKDRKQVLAMSGIGLTHDQIAKIMDISDETLRKYYPNELETGASRMNAMVAQNLYSIATSKGQGAVSAACFWLKTRARWHEVSRTEHTGPDGGPLQVETQTIDASELSREERDVIRQTLLSAKEKAARYDA